jgi:CRISPR/Cas system-associated exonuclease Cas4 (RecB family)
MANMSLEENIKRRFLKAIINDMEKNKGKEYIGTQVTDVSYDCNRRAYYNMKYREKGENIGVGESDLIRMWTGIKLHETPITENHEVDVEAYGIHGRIDEIIIDVNTCIILDKKSTRNIPQKPYDHHIKQVKYYAVMLKHHKLYEEIKGKKTYGAILYIDVDKAVTKCFVFDVDVNDKDIENEIKFKSVVLESSIKNNVLPEPKPSWECGYCDFMVKCVKSEDIHTDTETIKKISSAIENRQKGM